MLVALLGKDGELMRDDDDLRLLIFDVESEDEARILGSHYPEWVKSLEIDVVRHDE